MAVGKRQIRANVVVLVTLREDLRAELTAQIAVGGQLSHQHALVVAAQAVHGHRRNDVPPAANAVVHGEAVASFKGVHPRARNQFNASLRSFWLTGQANRDVAVVGQLGNERNRSVRQIVGGCTTKSVLIEARGCVERQREFVVAREARDLVVAVRHVQVDTVGAHAIQLSALVARHEFEAQTVALHRGGEVKRVAANGAVVRGRGVFQNQLVRTLRRVVGWDDKLRSRRVLHRDGLSRRRAVASVVRRSERANNV